VVDRALMSDRSRDVVMREVFGVPRALIGMVHVGALPGTPEAHLDVDTLVAQALADASAYQAAGFHAIVIENMHDRPYLGRDVGPEITAFMTVVAREVRREVALPLGVQVLAGANREALAIAFASGAAFVRVEGFVFAHVADEGLLTADAGPLLRYRRAIGAEHVRVFADVKKKHSAHAITADVDLATTALGAEFALADGVIVTGITTGGQADPVDVEAVADAVSLPVFVGSGITSGNLKEFAAADGFIVGSSVKHGGVWHQPVDPARAAELAAAFERLPAPKR
jgi:membrane complex biogenesis BtpA family protein